MESAFINRKQEIAELDKLERKKGLIALYGRRRIGKTRLLIHWLSMHTLSFYSQAIEGNRSLQLEQIFNDINIQLKSPIVPKTWQELFALLENYKEDILFCIDEFPYLVKEDASIPSIFQKWLDHKKKKNITLILAGSSTHMMHNIFLNAEAPLYGRALKLLRINPLSYRDFCAAFKLDPRRAENFTKFSIVGGIPKYWELIDIRQSPREIVDDLFFSYAPYMEEEPKKILYDENVYGINPVNLLETIGRGCQKPSEMASRLNTVQSNISRVLQQLLDVNIITREIPFGESTKTTKLTLYKIQDPCIRFWYNVYSPHRVRWHYYNEEQKNLLIHEHTGTVFEDYWRILFPGSSRFWERDIEFDLVSFSLHNPKELIVAEVKWKKLTQKEKETILSQLSYKWQQSRLSQKYPKVRFHLFDQASLGIDEVINKPVPFRTM